ncbi:WhiB family transcriptional regulator [Streptomyces sp. NPDC127037]|uniref:WhiB family transcriptional regulator n=1 Tax=Streptomyces sp. NPDC127037 TaxID=3347113 RepID=UPI00364A3B11
MPMVPSTSHAAPDNLPTPRSWFDDAACRGLPINTFFPVGKGPDALYAKAQCAPCPVRSECLTHALTAREDYGVWGGFDEHERAEMLAEARRAAERQHRAERERERANASSAA